MVSKVKVLDGQATTVVSNLLKGKVKVTTTKPTRTTTAKAIKSATNILNL